MSGFGFVAPIPGPAGANGAAGSTGATGATGATGPNTVSTSTATDITGIIYGNGSTVAAATAAQQLGSFTKAQLDTAISDGNAVYVGDGLNGSLGATTPASVAATTGAFSGNVVVSGTSRSVSVSGVGAVSSGDRYTIFHTDTTFSRSVGLFHTENGAEGGIRSSSQIHLKPTTAVVIYPSSQMLVYSILSVASSEFIWNTTGGSLVLTASSASITPLKVRGFASQSANLHEWQNSAGAVLASVSAGGNLTVSGTISLITVGNSITYKSGTGQRAGNATLVSGTVTVTNTSITANSVIVLIRKTSGGTIGDLTYTLSAGAWFTINSANILDTSVVSYLIQEVV